MDNRIKYWNNDYTKYWLSKVNEAKRTYEAQLLAIKTPMLKKLALKGMLVTYLCL